MCHMITIIDDNICENSSESFFLSLTVGTSENITIWRPLTEVIIFDKWEQECGESSNTYINVECQLEDEGVYDLWSPCILKPCYRKEDIW